MILIILGHSHHLYEFPDILRFFIYTFHYHCFFILPFLYPTKQFSLLRVKNNIARLLIPYAAIYAITFVALFIITAYQSGTDNLARLLWKGVITMILGGYYPLYNLIHLRYLWFLPAMFTMLMIKDYYYTRVTYIKRISFLLIGLFCYFFLWVCLEGPYCADIREKIMYCSPLSIWQALGIFVIGWAVRNIIQAGSEFLGKRIFKVLILMGTVMLLLLYINTPQESAFLLPIKAVSPIIVFLLLFSYRYSLCKLKILKEFGEHSFEIYLVQTPVCVIMYTFIPRLFDTHALYVRVLLFLFVITLCYYLALLLKKIPYINKVLFSQSLNDLMKKE